MARSLGETTITNSVLDRLLDLEPETQMENTLSRAQSVRLLRGAVRRDLEWLLNTRRLADVPEDGPPEINRSMLVFGLPDLSTLSMATAADRSRLTRQVAAAIANFEPRLAGVRVSLAETSDPSRKDVRMRIEAMLRMDPVPEPISFDTVLELKTGNCRVSGGDDAR
ncbi:MAG: type VI secretion system baseplate subunit TssE [Acidobacteriaceae bacterium]